MKAAVKKPVDIYQERYLAHQARKKAVLIEIMKQRHSDRMFSDKDVPEKLLDELIGASSLSPSSCDRRGVSITVIEDRDNKDLLGGLLVGGVGWVHRAKYILLIFADPKAYKAEAESSYMPFLDAGVMVQQLLLAATAEGLASCYVNPSVRDSNKDYFQKVFGEEIFCGAIAIGWPIR